jgi:hypothetical protein
VKDALGEFAVMAGLVLMLLFAAVKCSAPSEPPLVIEEVGEPDMAWEAIEATASAAPGICIPQPRLLGPKRPAAQQEEIKA